MSYRDRVCFALETRNKVVVEGKAMLIFWQNIGGRASNAALALELACLMSSEEMGSVCEANEGVRDGAAG